MQLQLAPFGGADSLGILIYPPPRDRDMSTHKRPEVDQRLARIEGHVRAIRKMLNEERAYPEIAHQVSAVKAALDGVLEVIVEDIAEDCVTTARRGERVNDLVLELKQVVTGSR